MAESRIAQLIVKQLRGELSIQEKEELQDWINQSPSNKQFMETRMNPEMVEKSIKALLEKNSERMHSKFATSLHQLSVHNEDTTKPGLTQYWRWGAIAAAALVLLVPAGFYLWRSGVIKPLPQLMDLAIKLPEIGKSPTRPSLSMANGDTVFVDRNANGIILEKGGWQVSQVDSQHLVYTRLPEGSSAIKKTGPDYLSFSTPYGQSWIVSLPDGSQIQLSTGSTLLYAVNISDATSKARVLALYGEACFELAANPQTPFVVATKKATINVIGTSFNLRDYSWEESSQVTLVKGSIRVSNGKNNTTLLPGEGATIDIHSDGIILVKNVDTSKALDWRNNYFDFTDMNIRQVMQQLNQWYGMEGTVYRGKVDTLAPDVLGGGHVAKDVSLKELLDKLQSITDLRFGILGKKIIVSSKK